MNAVTTLFWDLGGVILSNGWDGEQRARAIERFKLDAEDFEDRHELVNAVFEAGRMTLDAYLERTIFYRARSFSQDEFKTFMFAQSKENSGSRAVLDGVTASGRYLQAVINNEAAELNVYRIREFHLTRNFTAFFSSCYLGMRKPDEGIYRAALEITHRAPEECIFIDDRPPNLEPARKLGMRTIHFQSPAQLSDALRHEGVGSVAA